MNFRLGQAKKAWAGSELQGMLPSDAQVAQMATFVMPEPTKAIYCGLAGRQQELHPWDVDAAMLDPLATSLPHLLTELNSDPEWQQQLRVFCAAYMGVEVSSALVAEADRLGFRLLGQVAGDAAAPGAGAQQQRWRQFRFQFQREMKNAEGFWNMLREMGQEVEAAGTAS